VLTHAEIAAQLPHAGAMVLLDRVVDHDAERVVARTESHRRTDNPLRRAGRVRAIAGSEYGAQAAALHGPLCQGGDAAATPGMVVSVRDLVWTRARLDDVPGELEVVATCELADGRQRAYAFQISGDGRTLVTGRIGIVLT
jgi:predicted hotdog family 3-hydroxylacyl-ACP dehydratase